MPESAPCNSDSFSAPLKLHTFRVEDFAWKPVAKALPWQPTSLAYSCRSLQGYFDWVGLLTQAGS